MNTTKEFYEEFDKFTSVLQAFAYSLTKNQEAARDLYQETAFRALKNRDKFSPGTNFKAWLMTIMKNIFINNYRRKVKENTMVDTTDNLYFINSATTVRNSGDAQILMKELLTMVDNLDNGLKIPFLMHYRGFKYQEIADYLDLPLGTVKSRIFFARKELKQEIEKRYQITEADAILNR
ncbi:MAG: RNA polymerase sigma factor [Saprospiraceae bacterium]|jgi:RNA polymerase sigma-70 factor (ECF subfamily)